MDATTTPTGSAAADTNPFRHAARVEKARLLTAAIDGVLPHIMATRPESALAAVEGMGDVGWASAASVAGVNLPSDETKEIVLDTYRRRVKASLDARVAEAIAGALRAA